MKDEDLEKEFKEWYKTSDCELTGVSIGIARCIFQVGAKAMQKYNEQLKQQNERLVKRIYELQSDLSRLKSLNEKMKRCCNCVHRFVRHISQEGTCQRPNCKKYSDWCFDGQFSEIEK